MARIDKHALTEIEIIKEASRSILEKGYSNTTIKSLSTELGMSPGNITFYFPTKEHLLAKLVDILCDFQWKTMEKEASEDVSSVLAICLELAAMVVMCEEDEVAKEFYVATYTSPLCLEIIRRNDAERAQKVFAEYRSDWEKEQFVEAEMLVSGIEFASLIKAGEPIDTERKISTALNVILQIYGVPEEIREQKIKKVLNSDYRRFSKTLLKEFKKYVDKTNENLIEEIIRK